MWILVLIIFLIFVAALLAAAEIAFTLITPAKVKALHKEKKFGVNPICKLKQNPAHLLTAILIANSLATVLATALATLWATKVYGNKGVGIITGVLTIIILLFAEITPKTFAQKYYFGFARFISYPLLILYYILKPVIFILYPLVHGLMRIFGSKQKISTISEDEILALVQIGTQEGVIESHERELIENVIQFTDMSVADTMTHAKDIECLEDTTTAKDAIEFFVTHTHSRIPVYKKDINNIIGIITDHEALRAWYSDKNKLLRDLKYNPLIYVPMTQSISALFRQLKKRRQHMAIVVDEYGHTIGLITMEDILEEIVGDILDEEDREFTNIRKVGKNLWEAKADVVIEDVNDALNIKLNYPKNDTIGLLILEKIKQFPKESEKITIENLSIQIKKMYHKKIDTILISKIF